MIRLGLRLAFAGGRAAITRLALIAVAVAIGVGLLLTTLATSRAVGEQNARFAWLETAYTGSNAPATGSSAGALWWQLRADYFRGAQIGRVDLAPTTAAAPIPPGLSALPGPGEYYASPALVRLLRQTPASELADRYPGRLVGTIGSAALPAPNSLIIVIGHQVAELAHQPDVSLVDRISTTAPDTCSGDCALGVGIDANGITLVLSVVAAALLFPVLIFIGGATRLSAARREERFAAMRLVGATPRQVAVVATVESSVATVVGVALGFGLFYAWRPVLAGIPFTGSPFFTSDLSPGAVDIGLVAAGIPLAAAVVARLALRRVNISPLGVARRTAARPPRAWRLLPLLAGLAELGYFAYVHDIGASTPTPSTEQAGAFLSGVLVTMAGLVIAGPWLTMAIARLMARRAARPASLIAARRLADNPQAGFRAISGLALAVFVGTCATAIITTIEAYGGGSAGSTAGTAGTLVQQFWDPERTQPGTTIPPATLAELRSISGVVGVATVHAASDIDPTLISCTDLAMVPALGRCPAGATVVRIFEDYGGAVTHRASMGSTVWPSADTTPAELQAIRIRSIVVATDGASAAVEQARTVLGLSYHPVRAPQTMAEISAEGSREIDDYRQLANVVILTSLPIAGCSLAVSVAGGLADRRRPFSLLRLAGMRLATLRRVITLETAAPLLVTAAASAGVGFLAAQLFLRAQLKETLQAPDGIYYGLLAVGLLASLGVVASTLPLLTRLTGPDSARND